MKVLVCDDTITNRQLIGAYLQQMGHQAIFAENGAQAIKLFTEQAPDLVLIDVEMPEMNGYEATRAMRRANNYGFSQWVPVIFISGCIDDQSVAQGIDAGGDDYLTKPISQELLRAKIQAMTRLVAMKNRLMEMSTQLKDTNEKLLQSNKLLSELSLTDPLTHFGNRRAFEDNLERCARTAIRENKYLTLLMIDVDYFKLFNDSYGHPAGDNCLQQVANALKTGLHRAADFCSRYGGEEFAIVLPDTPLSGGVHVAERLRQCVEVLQLRNENAPHGLITISVGVATVKATKEYPLEALIASADGALYEAKKEGRNCIIGSNAMVEEVDDLPVNNMQKHFPHRTSRTKH